MDAARAIRERVHQDRRSSSLAAPTSQHSAAEDDGSPFHLPRFFPHARPYRPKSERIIAQRNEAPVGPRCNLPIPRPKSQFFDECRYSTPPRHRRAAPGAQWG